VASFNDLELSKGWWFYFALRYVSETPEFRLDFEKELLRLISEEGSFVVYGKNDQIKKRVSVRSVRR
jgi:hypothetical protein